MAYEFFEMVQKHEREWGNETYNGKPPLKHMMQSPVVVFWQHDKIKRVVATCYADLKDLEKFYVRLLVLNQRVNRNVVAIFHEQQLMRITGVAITFSKDTLPQKPDNK